MVRSCASSVLLCVAHFFSARGSLRVTVTLPQSSPSQRDYSARPGWLVGRLEDCFEKRL